MAQKVSVLTLSDLSETEGASTVLFGLDGSSYEIDLTDDETVTVREFLAVYVGAARNVGGPKRARAAGPVGPDPKSIRAWALEAGVEVPARGRLPKAVVEAYEARGEAAGA